MNHSENNFSLIKRLRRNKSAVVALFVIVLTLFVALFAYPLSPDKSPNANQMIIELSAKPAGYKQQLLLLKKNIVTQPSFFNKVFFGFPATHDFIPINSYYLQEDTLFVSHYIEELLADTLSFPISAFGDLPPGKSLDTWLTKDLIKEKSFILGTDRYGRDIFSRLLVGSRVSIAVGIVAVVLSLSIGIFMGSIAGWYGGWIDNTIMWLVNILWSIPTLLLVFAITLSVGKGFWEIFIAIGLTSWVSTARLIRGQVMQIKEMDYVAAARVLGIGNRRIIIKHILPNISGPVMVIAAANFATAILVEAGLSFLGIGVQPPTPSWGLMIKEHYSFLIAGNPLPAIAPGIAIMILVLAFNILGNGLRDAIDVRA